MDIPIEQHKLKNGLRVVLSEEHSSPSVAIAVYYDVGSRNEKKGRTGFAHLFEHMMFEGSENVGKTEHMKYISRAGGTMNGTTSEDRTNYFEILPSHQLALGLWLESDRMRSLKITKENFENQRATVKEERRQGIDNQPYGEGYIKIREIALENYPYRHPVIGYMEDLDAARLEDVQEFFNIYYAPNNAVLTIAGDFVPKEAMQLAEKYFASIPSNENPEPVIAIEPEQQQEKKEVINDPKIVFPGFWIAYHIPEHRHPDIYSIEILQRILFHGTSSRLYRLLIKEEQVALECKGWTDEKRGPGLFLIWCISKGEKNERVRELIDSELEKIRKNGISDRELQKAKNIIKSEYINHLQTNIGKALILSEFALYDDDPGLVNSELNRYLAVKKEGVCQALNKYFVPKKRTILDILPPKK